VNKWRDSAWRSIIHIPGIRGTLSRSLLMPRSRKQRKLGTRTSMTTSGVQLQGPPPIREDALEFLSDCSVAQSGAETSHANWSYPRSNLCSCLIIYCWLPRTRKGTSNMGESDRRRPRNDQGSTAVGVFGSLHNDGPPGLLLRCRCTYVGPWGP
jgi:hypothetical protein